MKVKVLDVIELNKRDGKIERSQVFKFHPEPAHTHKKEKTLFHFTFF